MRFEWDEEKNMKNISGRGLSFATAALVFDGPVVEREDLRFPYGERRIVAIGMVNGRFLTVIFTDRTIDEAVARRIISARRSNRREQVRHAKAFPTEA